MLQIHECLESTNEPIIVSKLAGTQRDLCRSHQGKTPKNHRVCKLQSAASWNYEKAISTDPTFEELYPEEMNILLTKEEANKLVSFVGKCTKGKIKKGSIAARSQSAADRYEKLCQKEGSIPNIIPILEVKGPIPISKECASQIQSKEASLNNGKILKGSAAAYAQSAADKKLRMGAR